jgi:hypothetical protein
MVVRESLNFGLNPTEFDLRKPKVLLSVMMQKT